MENSYWHKQDADTPLFSNLLWSRPENKLHAGKLLIVGGNSFGFSAPAKAYQGAQTAGAGSCRVLLPDSLKKIVGKNISLEAIFAPSNPSGGFARQCLDELILQSEWADAILFAGDFGRNSETSVVLEKYITNSKKPLVITQDAADYFTANPHALLLRKNVCLVISFAQLRKLAISAKFEQLLSFSISTVKFVEFLHAFSEQFSVHFVVRHLDNTFVASNGQVSSTLHHEELQNSWRLSTASAAAVWWMQNPTIPFKALTTAVIANQDS
jgi:hypothetical protein